MIVEYNIYAGTRRVAALVPHERLDTVLSQVRNCHPSVSVKAYRVAHELAYDFGPKCPIGAECEPVCQPETV